MVIISWGVTTFLSHFPWYFEDSGKFLNFQIEDVIVDDVNLTHCLGRSYNMIFESESTGISISLCIYYYKNNELKFSDQTFLKMLHRKIIFSSAVEDINVIVYFCGVFF